MIRTRLMAAALASVLALPTLAAGPGEWTIPGTQTTLKLTGYIQLDSTYDFHGRTSDINGNDWASFVAVQPFDNTPGVDEPRKNQLYLTGRTSRVGLMTSTPTQFGPLATRLEADFNSPGFWGELATNSVLFRLRHAYAELGGFLVGQTWSTFMDLGSLPDTVDFNPTGANALTRQPMIRYTYGKGPASITLAVENAQSLDFGPDFDSVPDFIASATYSGKWGHVNVRGVTHEFRNAVDHSARAFAGGVSGSFKVLRDTLVWSVQGGEGIGRYGFNSLLQGGVDTATDIELWTSYAYHVGFTHVWNKEFRSNVAWGQTFFAENDAAEAAQYAIARPSDPEAKGSDDLFPNERIDTAYVNTFWSFMKNAEVGLEYAYGLRKTFREPEGQMHRVNGLVRFSLY